MKNLQFSRRRFVQLSAAGLGFAASSCTRRFTHGLAGQLYTVRDVLPQAPDETLKALSAIGDREVEAQVQDLDQFLPLFTEYSLRPVSLHLEAQLVMPTAPPAGAAPAEKGSQYVEKVIELAHRCEVKFLVVPVLPSPRNGHLDSIRVKGLRSEGVNPPL